MSSVPPVTVRYDVSGSQVVATENAKIAKSFHALRTSSGQVVSSVKQMQSGFSAGPLNAFSSSVQAADTRITSFKTKLAGIGQQFGQNATSFGVATASIWGVYNAYDSLEKVQIRAHAAATRVSTLETTIATLTQRRDQAVRKGNLSAEQMAILDDRITNAHNKLGVAQERNADLQQDVNEAWAAFASQVGPQVVAAGGSVVQLVTNLRGQFTGVIPGIKSFFQSFSSGTPAMTAANQSWIAAAPALRGMTVAEQGATVATRGLSLAMKSLLIGTGIGIAVTAIALLAEHFMNSAEAAKTSADSTKDSLAEGSDAVVQYGETFDTQFADVKTFLDKHAVDVGKAMDDVTKVITQARLDQMKVEIDFQKHEADLLNMNIQNAMKYKQDLQKQFDALKTGRGSSGPGAAAQRDELSKGIKQAEDDIKGYKKALDTLNPSLQKNREFYDKAVATLKVYVSESNRVIEMVTGIGNAFGVTNLELDSGGRLANQFFARFDTRAFLKGGGDIEVMRSKLAAFVEILKSPAINADPHVIEAFEKLANIKIDEWANKGKDALKGETDTMKEYDKILEDMVQHDMKNSIAKQEQINQLNEQEAALRASANEYIGYNEQSKLSVEELSRFVPVISAVTKPIHEQFDALVQGAGAWDHYGTAAFEADKAMQQQIFSQIKVNEILQFSQKNQLLYNQAQIQGRLNAQAFFTTQKLGSITAEQYRKDLIANGGETLKYANTNHMLTSEIEALIQKGFLPLQEQIILTERQMESARDSTLDFFGNLFDTENMKEFNKAWKELDLGSIPKKLKDNFKDMAEQFRGPIERGREVATALELISLNAMGLGKNLSKAQIGKTFKEIAKDFKEFATTDLEATKLLQLAPNIFEDLAKGGDKFKLTQIALTEAMKDGNITGDELNTILQEYGKATGNAVTPTQELNTEQQKIANNNILAKTINQVTINMDAQTKAANLQGQAVRGLTLDFNQLVLIMQKMVNLKNQGKGGQGGFTNVSENIPFDPTFQHSPGGGAGGTNEKGEPVDRFGNVIKSNVPDPAAYKKAADLIVAALKAVEVAAQKTQKGLANLAIQGANSLSLLAKASSTQMSGMIANLSKGAVGSQKLQTGIANLSNQGSNSFSLLAKASSTQMSGMINNMSKGAVGAQKLQTGLANLSNQGSNSLMALAHASSTAMNGIINNVNKAKSAISGLQSAINNLHGKTVNIGLSGPGVKFLATGYHGIVDEPTIMVVGEKGAERVDVSPVSASSHENSMRYERSVSINPVAGPNMNAAVMSRTSARESNVKIQAGPTVMRIEMPVYLFPGAGIIKRLIKEIPLEDTGMFASA